MPVTSESNIRSIRALATTSRGHLELALGEDGCFSHEREEIRLSWDEQRGQLDMRKLRKPARSVDLASDELRRYLEQIADALLRPEVPQGGRSTQRYSGSARWEAFADQRREAGEAQWETHDLPPEVIAEIVANRPDLASRIPPSTYAVAFGIRAVVTQIEERVGERP